MKKKRCFWVGENKPHYDRYHDKEWGVPVHNDKKHFEFLILEGAQAGLSWETILLRRQGYREAFANFDAKKVARFDTKKIKLLSKNKKIIRNHLKIKSAITNAREFLKIQKEFGSFDTYIWSFVKNRTIVNKPRTRSNLPTRSKESDALATDLKKRGFKFVGSTIMYAYMQATGLVDDHMVYCWRKQK
ncbi:MAG: DNA-3-methyladenine glycosylase [Bdellovibrionales bacterium RBG_16_40_8]|nr:MAG: DNA-3-methyladenine glycosylase [Bdellovibrionales bacterium RBG_16_40_8]